MAYSVNDYTVTRHICPRNCYGACGLLAYTKNGILEKVEGDPMHPYSKGMICSKGFGYVERNYHRDRIKYPMMQEVRGSGHWKRISWEDAIDRIAHKMLELSKRYDSNLSLCLSKYSGNFGILHNAVEGFFESIGPSTQVVGSPCWSAGLDAQYYDFGDYQTSDPEDIENSNVIFIWGGNPAWTAVHSMSYIYQAQMKGAKVIVIDPVYTTSAQKADHYVGIIPGSDGYLAHAIAKVIIERDTIDHNFLTNNTKGWPELKKYIETLDLPYLAAQAGVSIETIHFLADCMECKPVFTWIGFGLQRHTNGGQNIRAIQALSALTGNIGKPGSGVQFAQQQTWSFNYAFQSDQKGTQRQIPIHDFSKQLLEENEPPVKLLWVSCRNFVSQDPNRKKILNALDSLELIVTTDQFITSTADQSDIVLPTTTMFEESDIVPGYWHHVIGINEKAIEPYFESKSDIEIMTLLSKRLNELSPGFSQFPTEGKTDDFIEKEFNDELYRLLDISHWTELLDGPKRANLPRVAWENHVFSTPSKKFEFYSERALQNGIPPLAILTNGLKPTTEYPYWLITPHSQMGLNSQFLNIEGLAAYHAEPFIYLHPKTAEKHQIRENDFIKLYNDNGTVIIKAKYSTDIATDVLLFYQGWFPNTKININDLIDGHPTDMGQVTTGAKSIAFYDVFVNISS